MPENENHQTKTVLDILAFCISVVALGLSGAAFFYQFLRGAEIVAFPGGYIYITARPQIGIPVSFANYGAKAAVIDAGHLDLEVDSRKYRFKLVRVSPSIGGWQEDEKGNPKSIPSTFYLYTPLAVKAADTIEKVFWFIPETPGSFRFDQRSYNANLIFAGSKKELCRAAVNFDIGVEALLAASANRETIIPVKAK
jgi:hypothetical protein